ncbi:tRNA-(ms[2]io[6]A)-hydroxylase [Allopseudospirillum japonicum]|uniref:tRNA-(Ms[2]io[6]A)-hydroxylase n=1 Tax=Allopseudospirillum japonicum TaxID=64971 RepID=A0A1H6T7K3_9GAMM|nr:tRNA-(ms[2]io[6]A)-hydroxylase [Allopseudospirillum japonicum]SEI76073.1 tRNA-(ms[2]io[6]A)-hydroxylase [Allopseudospirillum japonicum]
MAQDPLDTLMQPIHNFLLCSTPKAWLEQAIIDLPTLLIDHAQCEKKAASSAMSLMYRYVDKSELLKKMSQLAREELLHFEQVVNLMQARDIEYLHLSAARYAEALRQEVSKNEPQRLIDLLIIGAIIEARSCERFYSLLPYLADLDPELAKYYRSLLRSEGRHFEDYLQLARLYSRTDIDPRIQTLLQKEQDLILSPDTEFRFHSGVPHAA